MNPIMPGLSVEGLTHLPHLSRQADHRPPATAAGSKCIKVIIVSIVEPHFSKMQQSTLPPGSAHLTNTDDDYYRLNTSTVLMTVGKQKETLFCVPFL